MTISAATSITACLTFLRPITISYPSFAGSGRSMKLFSSSSAGLSSSSSVLKLKPMMIPAGTTTKRVLLLRHGQALHNPRAEAARENGCSFDEFLNLMREDDAFDSPLTELGENQAMQVGKDLRQVLHNIDMIVSSPLSRALRTADLVLPPELLVDSIKPRRLAWKCKMHAVSRLVHLASTCLSIRMQCYDRVATRVQVYCEIEL
jgi:hypothetical protein